MPRFRDDTDFPDVEMRRGREGQSPSLSLSEGLDGPRKKANSLSAGGPSGLEDLGGGARGGTYRVGAPSTHLKQRDSIRNRYSANAVSTNVVSNLTRRRADALLRKGTRRTSDGLRRKASLSAATAMRSAVSSRRAFETRAKPTGADGREFTFTPGPKTFFGTYASIVAKPGGRFRFVLPHNVRPCIVRKTRREVLFAKKQTAKGSSKRRRRHNQWSHISCSH